MNTKANPLVAHLHFLPTQKPNKKMQKSYQANALRQYDNAAKMKEYKT